MAFVATLVYDPLAGWTVPGTYTVQVVVDVAGDGSYLSGGENIDVSTWLDTVHGAWAQSRQAQGSTHYDLLFIDLQDASALLALVVHTHLQVAGGTVTTDARWRCLLMGTKTIT